MTPQYRPWSGDSWEAYCLQLLSMRYGHAEFQRVPPSTGDLGIDGYSRDGCLYQCYALDETPSKKSPYEKLRNKLTEDISKLSQNAVEIKRLLGDLKIHRYIFMVPSFDRRLLEHAANKVDETRSKHLSFLDDDFKIQVVSDQDFPTERAALADVASNTIRISSGDVSEDRLGKWQTANTEMVKTLEEKLTKVSTLSDSNKRLSMRSELLRFYLRGEEIMQDLRNNYPSTWEKLYATRSSKERFLAPLNLLKREEAHDRLTRTIQEVKQEFVSCAREIDDDLAEQLAWSAAADWLVRCPLRFD